jgi:type II secretory pathway component PulF
MPGPYSHADLEKFWISLAKRQCGGSCLGSSVQAIEHELDGSPLAEVLHEMIEAIRGGACLHEAMRHHPAAFGGHVCALVEGGERAGSLERILPLIVEFAWRCPKCILGPGDSCAIGEDV